MLNRGFMPQSTISPGHSGAQLYGSDSLVTLVAFEKITVNLVVRRIVVKMLGEEGDSRRLG